MRNTERTLPALGPVMREHFWTAGSAMRWVAIAAAAYFILVTVAIALQAADQPSTSGVMPYVAALPAVFLGILMAQALWRRENPSERSYLHSMPVGRLTNHLLRNAAGWVWAMIAVALVYAWGVGAILSLTSEPIGSAAPWQWAAPFVCVTVAFLLSAATATAFNYPAAVVAMISLLVVVFATTRSGFAVALGHYGAFTMATGSRIVGDGDLMSAAPFTDWLIAAALWIALGLAALLVASAIRREE